MTWKADCDRCLVSSRDPAALVAYLNSGPPDAERAKKYGIDLIPCKKHKDA